MPSLSISPIASDIRSAIVRRVAGSLALLLGRFRPIYEFVDIETQTAPDGRAMEVEVRTPAVLVGTVGNLPLSHVSAWLEHDGDADCLKVELLGYLIEIFYFGSQRCPPGQI